MFPVSHIINQNEKTMTTEFRKSLTWKDTVKYAVDAYSFLIRGKGEMNGADFARQIRKHFECSDCRTKLILSEVEKHIVKIETTFRVTSYRVA